MKGKKLVIALLLSLIVCLVIIPTCAFADSDVPAVTQPEAAPAADPAADTGAPTGGDTDGGGTSGNTDDAATGGNADGTQTTPPV